MSFSRSIHVLIPRSAHAVHQEPITARVMVSLEGRGVCSYENRFRLLLTSRAALPEKSKLHELLRPVEVGPLNIESAKEILLHGDRGGVDDKVVEELAHDLDCIPLRLRIAAGILRAGRTSFQKLRDNVMGWRQGDINGWHDNCTFERESLKLWLTDQDRSLKGQLLLLSMFVASFTSEQAKRILDDSDMHVNCTLQVREGFVCAMESTGMPLWTIHDQVKQSVQSLDFSASERKESRAKFAKCMTEEVRNGDLFGHDAHALSIQKNFCMQAACSMLSIYMLDE
eukprot:1142766-Pelagomonas_calceolata.AAC.11